MPCKPLPNLAPELQAQLGLGQGQGQGDGQLGRKKLKKSVQFPQIEIPRRCKQPSLHDRTPPVAPVVIPDFDVQCSGGEEYEGSCHPQAPTPVLPQFPISDAEDQDLALNCEQFTYNIDSIIVRANEAKKSEDLIAGIKIYTNWLEKHGITEPQPESGAKDKDKGKCVHDRKSVALVYNNRGHLKYLRVDFQGALLDYIEAISYNSRLASAYYNRGTILYRMGDFQKALQDMTLANRLEPQAEEFQLGLRRVTDQVILVFGPIIPPVSLEELRRRAGLSAGSGDEVDGEADEEEEKIIGEDFEEAEEIEAEEVAPHPAEVPAIPPKPESPGAAAAPATEEEEVHEAAAAAEEEEFLPASPPNSMIDEDEEARDSGEAHPLHYSSHKESIFTTTTSPPMSSVTTSRSNKKKLIKKKSSKIRGGKNPQHDAQPSPSNLTIVKPIKKQKSKWKSATAAVAVVQKFQRPMQNKS